MKSLRLGLCCAFVEQPIHFRRTTARYVTGLKPGDRRELLRQIASDNARALARRSSRSHLSQGGPTVASRGR